VSGRCGWLVSTLIAGVLSGLPACQGPSPRPPPTGPGASKAAEPPGPSTPPASPPAEKPEPAPQPAEPTEAATDARASEPRPEPELPAYLRVLERFDPDREMDVRIELTPPRRLAIDTRNVRRLWIDRAALPLAHHRSIVLQLDGQGIEWTPQSTTSVFERSVNGVWAPAREPHD